MTDDARNTIRITGLVSLVLVLVLLGCLWAAYGLAWACIGLLLVGFTGIGCVCGLILFEDGYTQERNYLNQRSDRGGAR